MKNQQLNKISRGFTLVEILVVVAIIAVILGVGAAGIKAIADGNPTEAAANNLKSAAKEAQQLAKGRGVPARLVVYMDDSDPSQAGIQKFGRYYGVAIKNSSGAWELVNKGQYLPAGAYLDVPKSILGLKHIAEPSGLVSVTDPGKETGKQVNKFFYYEFNSQGIMVDPGLAAGASSPRGAGSESARLIVNEGKIGRVSGKLKVKTENTDELNYRGFYIYRSGKLADITDLESIVKTP